MNIQNARILLTGATGGIGQALAIELASQGAHLALVGRHPGKLQELLHILSGMPGERISIVADLEHPNAAQGVVDAAIQQLGGLDILINNAGVMDFIQFEDQSPERIAQIIQTNVTAPILLARAALPHFLTRQQGQLVNIGSIFGSIGFPHYASYCASKFAMRGFSQSLRRELVDTPVRVTYIAPRAVDTPLNDATTTHMLRAANISLDAPEDVARQIVCAIARESEEYYIGQPESFFAWLNSTLPKLVNFGMKKQARLAAPFVNRKPHPLGEIR